MTNVRTTAEMFKDDRVSVNLLPLQFSSGGH
jgi:hypothetical protein